MRLILRSRPLNLTAVGVGAEPAGAVQSAIDESVTTGSGLENFCLNKFGAFYVLGDWLVLATLPKAYSNQLFVDFLGSSTNNWEGYGSAAEIPAGWLHWTYQAAKLLMRSIL